MSAFVAVVNGPNLNLVGRREPEIYGRQSLADYLDTLEYAAVDLRIFQSNHEGVLIERIQEYGNDPECVGIVLNPGALAHYSYALADAIRSVDAPVVEVHISNIHAREEFRHTSVTGAAGVGMITGLGLEGYRVAIDWLLRNR